MPIDKFSSFDDGLDPNQRNRGHFIAEIDVEDVEDVCRNYYRSAGLDGSELDRRVR